MTEAERLLDTYNNLRRKTAKFQELQRKQPMRDLKGVTSKGLNRLLALEKLIDWCRQEGIHPERWLYTMFACYRWLYAPPLNNLVPRNKKRSKTYQLYFEDRETPVLDSIVQQRVQQNQIADGRRFDPRRDIAHSAEGIKRQLLQLGDPDECMERIAETFGYHPKSLACARCSRQQPCAQRLQSMFPFDILALRRGELTLAQVEQTAVMAGLPHVGR